MRISDWSSDVCSSDLVRGGFPLYRAPQEGGRASGAAGCRILGALSRDKVQVVSRAQGPGSERSDLARRGAESGIVGEKDAWQISPLPRQPTPARRGATSCIWPLREWASSAPPAWPGR